MRSSKRKIKQALTMRTDPSRAISETIESRLLLSSNPLDTTFGYNGIVTANPVLFANGGATAVHVLSNGDILVAGYGAGRNGEFLGSEDGLEAARYLPDGELDTTFGTDGSTYIPVSVFQTTGMAVTPAGDIILVGATQTSTVLARLAPSGILDTSFGTAGTAYVSGVDDVSIALGSDGSIYLGGTIGNANGTRFSMVKLNAGGTHSSIFNYSVEAYSGASAIVYSAGMLVLGGFSSAGAPGSATDTSQFTLLGVNTNGTIDQSFGSKGIVRTSIEVTSDIEGLALSPNGDIVAVGNSINNGSEIYAYSDQAILSDIALARYQPSGLLDTTFGTSGVVVTFGGDTSIVGDYQEDLQSVTTPSVAVEADGSIAVAGNILQASEGLFLAIHYGVSGNFLASAAFDVTSEEGPESFFSVTTKGSNIFAAGYLDLESPQIDGDGSDLILAKFNPDMGLSAGFAVDQSTSIAESIYTGNFLPGNIVVGNPDGYVAQAEPVADAVKSAQAPNGQILMLGPGYSPTTYSGRTINVDLTRYNTDGTRDLSLPALSDVAGTAITVQSDGKILIAGDAAFGFQRLNSDGSVDTSFVATGPSLIGASSIIELPGGDLLVAVGSDVYRFLSNGTFDTTFGIAGVATNANLSAAAMTVESNGTIVVVGGNTVECFTYAGLVDAAFNTTGQLTLSDSEQDTDLAATVLIDSHGNILVGGANQVVAVSASGSLIPGFGTGGMETLYDLPPTSGDTFTIGAMALDSSGNILVGGAYIFNYTPEGPTDSYESLIRLTPAGRTDTTFGDNGFTSIAPIEARNEYPYINGIFTNAQGKIYLSGIAGLSDSGLYVVTLARFNDAATISGTVFNDANGDGKQEAGEAGIAGRTVYADLSNSGHFETGDPYTITNSQGKYTLTGLPAGPLLIRQILPAGQRESTPAYGGAFHVTLGSTPLTNINFGSTSTIYISGEVFNDTNGNGKLDAGETGLAGVRIYLDIANTGSYLPTDDPSAITNANGDFVFTGIAAATYFLRIVTPTGCQQTYPADDEYKLIALPSGGVEMNVFFGVK